MYHLDTTWYIYIKTGVSEKLNITISCAITVKKFGL